MVLAREKSGLSQAKLGEVAGWNPGNVSKLENGQKGASIETIDSWMDACGMELIVVPKGPIADLREVSGLRQDLLELLLRLARILPWLPEVLVKDLRGRVDSWIRDYPAPVSTLATTQDTTDSLS